MSERLDVNTGETYTISSGETEEWKGVDVDGTLEINGTLKLIDEPNIPQSVSEKPESEISNIDSPFLLIIFGILSSITYAGIKLKSPMVIIIVALNIIILMLSIILNISIVWFYILTIIGTFTVVIASFSRHLPF